MLKKIIRQSYDQDANRYDRRFRPVQWPKYEGMLGPQAALLRPLVGSGGRLLDLGCGTGLLYRFLDERLPLSPATYIGADLSHRMTAQAGARGASVVQADMDRLPFADGAFDAVLAFTSVALFPEMPVEPALQEAGRVLKPGGMFVITLLSKKLPEGVEERLQQCGFTVMPPKRCGQDQGWLCWQSS